MMNVRSPLLFSILAVFGSILSAHAQVQVIGKILEQDGDPLEYASVALYHEQNSLLVAGVVTDVAGKFSLAGVKKGKYYLVSSFIGYNSTTISGIAVDGDPKDLGEIRLLLGATALNELTVKGDRAAVVNKIDRQVFDASTFQSAQGRTGLDILRNLPSVSINGEGEVSVRGTTGFVMLLNGKPLQGDATSLLAQLPANAIENIELITAPSSKYDPEGKAGIINIITKKGATDGVFAQVNVQAGLPSIETYDNAAAHQRYGIDGTYNVRTSQWNISMGASYQRNDLGGKREGDVYTILNDTINHFPSDGERSTDEINYTGRFTVDFTPDKSNAFSFGLYSGKRDKKRLADIVYYNNESITPVENGTTVKEFQYFNHNLQTRTSDFLVSSLDYSHRFVDQSRLSTSLLYEYTLLGGPTINQNLGHPDNEIIYQEDYNTNRNPLNGVRYQLDYALKPLPFGVFETGYQYRYLLHVGDFIYARKNTNTGDFEIIPDFSSEVDLKQIIHSGYVQFSGKTSRWNYAAGTRLEAMDRSFDLQNRSNTIDTTYYYDFVKLFPAASVQYSMTDDLLLKASYSKRIERTTTFKMNPFPEREHSETLEQGDATLLPEFIDLVEAGATRTFEKGHTIFATAYFRNVKNLINRVNTVYNDTILNRIYSNVGTGRSLGLEVGADLKLKPNWSSFIGGNVYHYAIKGSFANKPVDTQSTVFSINANTTFKFWKTASVQFTINYLSARNTAQGEDSRFYQPNITLRKTFLDNRLGVSVQWLNMDMGLLKSNEQRITTFRTGEFYTTTNYIYEVDIVMLNFSYTFNYAKNSAKFIKSEFGEREF
jgi:iron complex outermembrane receptor protein